jgi:hypothetical protein
LQALLAEERRLSGLRTELTRKAELAEQTLSAQARQVEEKLAAAAGVTGCAVFCGFCFCFYDFSEAEGPGLRRGCHQPARWHSCRTVSVSDVPCAAAFVSCIFFGHQARRLLV